MTENDKIRYYEIRLFDRTLVELSIQDGMFGPEVELISFDESASALMPCGLSLDEDGIWHWLETRSIPANRRNAARICRELGFRLGDLESLYRASMGLSLNDSYWVVPRGFIGAFADYSLFENPFSEAIGALAVAGELREATPHGNTPELTTDGTLRKGWRIIGSNRVLYKGASEGCDPGEPLSEYIASLIASGLRLNAVKYDIDAWQGETCSTCACFCTKDVSYVPFAVATGMTDLAGVLWWCAAHGEEWLEAVCDMLAFDALICNTDRHLSNFGILRDNYTGKAIGLAPIFDNGRSLFPNVREDNVSQFLLESQLRSPAFGGRSFEELLSRVIGQRQVALLEAAADIGIVGNTKASGKRVSALDRYIRTRAKELSALMPVDHEELVSALNRAMARRSLKADGLYRLD